MKVLDKRSLDSFLVDPLTPDGIQRLHAKIDHAKHRIRRSNWWLSALYILTSIGVTGYFTGIFTQLIFTDLTQFALTLALSLAFFDALVTGKWGALSVLTLFFSSLALCALVLGPLLVVVFVLFTALSGVYTGRCYNLLRERDRLQPVSPDDCAAALDEALAYPEVEQFRQDLLQNGREFLTSWEYEAVLNFKEERIEAERVEKTHARCQQFMTAKTLPEATG